MRFTRALCTLSMLLLAATTLRAQQAAQPGDSIRVRFDARDIWHYGVITDRFQDTLVVRGCAGCKHDPFVVTSAAAIDAFRARQSSAGHRAIIGFILGAGAGAALGGLGQSGCVSGDTERSGPKCVGVTAEAGALLGGLVGAVAGAISGHVGRHEHWEPVS